MTDTAITPDKTIGADSPRDCQLQTPGVYLQKAREKAGLTEESVAEELRISVSKLQALETEHYEKIASPTFVKGYLRTYARVVGLDANEVVQHYEEYLSALADTSEIVAHSVEKSARADKAEAPRPKWQHPAAIAAVLLVVWVLAAYLFGTDSSDEEGVSQPATVTAEVPNAQPKAVFGTENPVVVETQIAAAESVTQDTTKVDTPQVDSSSAISGEAVAAPTSGVSIERAADTAPQSGAVEAVQPQAAEQRDVLQFAFSGECWVEVSDALGDVLFTDLQQPGASLTLEGKAPFKVMLGNGRAVTLSLNGEAVSTEPSGNRNILRLTVGKP